MCDAGSLASCCLQSRGAKARCLSSLRSTKEIWWQSEKLGSGKTKDTSSFCFCCSRRCANRGQVCGVAIALPPFHLLQEPVLPCLTALHRLWGCSFGAGAASQPLASVLHCSHRLALLGWQWEGERCRPVPLGHPHGGSTSLVSIPNTFPLGG